MKRLTALLSQRVESQRGLFDLDAWNSCVSHLFATRTDDDPSCDTAMWNQCMQLVRVFVDDSLQCALSRFPALGHECLLMASSKEMKGPPVKHALNEDPCAFSGRTELPAFRTPTRPEPFTVNSRVQCQFHWSAHHAMTGMECPHASSWYVFESQYTFLVLGMYMLGHLGPMLKQQAKSTLPGASADEFQRSPLWEELYQRINSAMFVVWKQLH
jgi:hypothetical protein